MLTNNSSTSPATDIMVVDDEIGSRRLLTEILTNAGYRVRPADGPQVALESALAYPPGLILLDVRMPEMNGFEVCRRLNQDERTSEIPIIFVSALQDVDDRVQGFEAGGVDFISKPFQEAEVLVRVKTHVQLRTMQLYLETQVAERTAELRATNKALGESEEKYRTVVEQATEGILVIQDGRRKYYNLAWLEMTGYSAEEYDPTPFLSLIYVDDLETVKTTYQNLVMGQEFGASPDFRITDKSGDIKWLSIRGSTIQWEGKPAEMIFIEDITERKQAEEELRISEEKFYKVFQSSPASITITKLSTGEFIDVNQTFEQTLGYSKEEIIGASSLDINIWKNLADRDRLMPLYLEQRYLHEQELELIRKSGETAMVDIHFSLIRIGDEDFSISAFTDITERKQAEQAVQAYQQKLKSLAAELTLVEERERRRIAADLHDEVGQTLALARIQLARARKATGEAKVAAILDDVSESVRRTIQDTRDLVFDLSSPLLNELGLAAALAEWLEQQVEKKHGLQTEFIDAGQKIVLNEDVRAILFRNVRELLTNVVRHAEADKVSVRVERVGDTAIVVVQDDGMGFDPLAASEATDREDGFGLFSIRERMLDLGGNLEIVSEPGQGCTAILTTPLKNG